MDKRQSSGSQEDLLAQLLSQRVTPSPPPMPAIPKQVTAAPNTNPLNSKIAHQKNNQRLWRWPTLSEASIGLIGALIGSILTGVFSNSVFGDFILSRFRTDEVVVTAVADNSGSALRQSGQFISFRDAQIIHAPGDNTLDQETILFLTFDLRGIPKDVRIDKAELLISCKATGSPKDLGDLTLQATWYGRYDPSDVNIRQKSPYDPSFFIDDLWTWNDSTVSRCTNGTTIRFSPNALVDFISQVYWSRESFQCVVYFDKPTHINNRIEDSLIVEALPQLHIQYSPAK